MDFVADIGIIGALDDELSEIIARLTDRRTECISGIEFNCGELLGKRVAVAKCGVGKVFAALCAEAMILRFSPSLIVNTGVGGALAQGLAPCDIVFADRLVQHDMDTSPLGDPKGLISGINKVYFDTDRRALDILTGAAVTLGINYRCGTVATGDSFISGTAAKDRIVSEFGADACEMEGGAIAQVAYVNSTPFAVIRAISDSADGSSAMDYPTFLPLAAKSSAALTLALVEKY